MAVKKEENMKIDFERGDQIAYIPTHAEGDIRHRDVEFGFVTSTNDHVVFCRYWGKTYSTRLRTRSCSEATQREDLIKRVTRSQELVNEQLIKIEKEKISIKGGTING